jgi:Signal transduction histidine kinase regulating C4-dicarboxylate transport system
MSVNTSNPSLSTYLNSISESNRDRILIADDSPTVRAAFRKHLSLKYECIEAGSVAEALNLLKGGGVSLVIADIQMPGLSGIELLRKVVESYPPTPVIMVSGIDRPQRVLDAIRLGAFDYLVKPFDLYILELTVERAIERRNLLANAQKYKSDLEARNHELADGKAQLERLQVQIVQNAKMASLGQLAAGVAHELNNPVGFVHGNLNLLNETVNNLLRLLKFYDGVEMPKEIADGAAALKQEIAYEPSVADLDPMFADCREGAERILDIVKNLKTFSRLDEADFKKTDLHEGIDSTVRILSRYFSSENIRLVRDYCEPIQIDAYSGQLNQVWMNLLGNAAQAVKEKGGDVRVKTRQDGGFVIISISDTGKGIAPENVNRIFDPFFTTKPVGEGTGLGLSISFGIVKRHQGDITVQSEPDKGTTMTVKLPVTAEMVATG